jgi:colanic acid/amylovoran biosynthesis glycosyltransferase
MRVAYLSSEYPKVTHTFIRREILGVERHGIDVLRLAIRKPRSDELPEADDRRELERTEGILGRGAMLAVDAALTALRRPRRFLAAASKALRYGLRSQRGLARHAAYFVEACAVARLTEASAVEHLHAHFGMNAAMVAMLARELGGPPFSFMIHGPGEFDAAEMLHLPQKVAAASFVTAITDFARSQTWRWSTPDQWPKVHVVRCGVDRTFLEVEPQPVPDVPRFLNIGRMGRSKAQPLILQAAAALRDRGRELEVVVIGDGELRGHLERMIARLRLEGIVKLVGWKDGAAVRRALLDSRALLLPSFGEGLPVVIMEAFALARPVITTRIAGIPELVVDGENGWLIPAGNLERLVEAMAEALDAPPARLTAMGLAGRAAVIERHDSEREATKLAGLLLASRAAAPRSRVVLEGAEVAVASSVAVGHGGIVEPGPMA